MHKAMNLARKDYTLPKQSRFGATVYPKEHNFQPIVLLHCVGLALQFQMSTNPWWALWFDVCEIGLMQDAEVELRGPRSQAGAWERGSNENQLSEGQARREAITSLF
jgi:hypothetical protein